MQKNLYKFLLLIKLKLQNAPAVKEFILKVLNNFPTLKYNIKKLLLNDTVVENQHIGYDYAHLTPHTQALYTNINNRQTIQTDLYENRVFVQDFIDIIYKYDLNEQNFILPMTRLIDNYFQTSTSATLYIDITKLRFLDYGTGIQRVVRSIIFELYNVNYNLSINLVYIENNNGIWQYKRACDYEKKYFDTTIDSQNYVIEPLKNDIFLGLDLVDDIIHANSQNLFSEYKKRGVKINFVIYDILPVLYPQWWPQGGGEAHTKWLQTILEVSDNLLCISKAVATSVQNYIIQNSLPKDFIQKLKWFHLGADVKNSIPSYGLPQDAQEILSIIKSRYSFLMVSTIEPRKGHHQTLLAFEKLWEQGYDINLLIVGKKGWMMDEFMKKLTTHPQLNKKLFWFNAITDEYLEKIYTASTALIASSQAEGFGLPLIEAAQYSIPIIARDIDVFREVANSHAYYFKDDLNPSVIVDCIKEWLLLYKSHQHPKSQNIDFLTWKDSAKQLMTAML